MSGKIEFEVPVGLSIPSEIVLREGVFVSLNSAAAGVQAETVFRLRPLGVPPQVTSFCNNERTWTFSGSHMTGDNGTVEIYLNKFLDCIPTVIRDVVVGQNDLPTVAGVFRSNYIGSRPSFIATPESEEPVFLTCAIDARILQPRQSQDFFYPQALDITVKVRSWKHDGTLAPKITFNWIAITSIATEVGV